MHYSASRGKNVGLRVCSDGSISIGLQAIGIEIMSMAKQTLGQDNFAIVSRVCNGLQFTQPGAQPTDPNKRVT